MKKTIALTWGILGAVTGAYADQTVQTKSIPEAPTTVLKTDVSQPAMTASLPQQPTVISGQAAITTQGQKMTITPSQQNTLINWNSFNIAANHHVHHNHASSAHTTVHNVTSGAPSTLSGTLSANQGNVFLVNSGGIVVTKGAHIDMGNQGKFVASTYTLKNPGDFTAGGRLQFADNPDAKHIQITGDFTFSGAGLAFIAPGIGQRGAIIGLASPVSDRDDALDISFFDDRFQLRLEGKTAQTIKDQKVQNDVTIRSILAKNSKQGAHALTAEQVSEGFTAMNPVHTNADAQQIEQNAVGDVWLIGAPNGGQVNVNNDIQLKGGADAAAGKAIILGDEVNLNTGTFDLSANHTAGQLFVGVKPTYQRLNQYQNPRDHLFTKTLNVGDDLAINVKSKNSRSGRINWLSSVHSTFGKADVTLGNGWIDFSGTGDLSGVESVNIHSKNASLLFDPAIIEIIDGDAGTTNQQDNGINQITDGWLNAQLATNDVYISTFSDNSDQAAQSTLAQSGVTFKQGSSVSWGQNVLGSVNKITAI